jgi:CheY-like chemotaxis protein
MTLDQATKLIEAIAKLLGSIAWPIIVLFIILRFLPAILSTLTDLDDFSIDVFGFKAAAKRKAKQASEALGAAAGERPPQGETIASATQSARQTVERSVTPNLVRKLANKRILWVDDRPPNNVRARDAFEALGLRVQLALSTEEALTYLDQERFDLVISDMGRPPDMRAGYTLLDTLRRNGNAIPFVIYAGSNDPEHRAETKAHGGLDCTNRADELFTIVTEALSR